MCGQRVNKLPRARIVISDGSAAGEDFPISDSPPLIPGATVSIALGYGSTETVVFAGIVDRQGLETSINGPPRLVAEATDKAMMMTLSRANAVFQNVTDSELCSRFDRRRRTDGEGDEHLDIACQHRPILCDRLERC